MLPLPTSPDATPPERLPVIPAAAAGKLVGHDGRSWRFDAATVLAALNATVAKAGPIALDENHSSVVAAPKGLPSPAMARLSKFELGADGGIYAHADWTPGGLEVWRAGAYQGLSPTLLITDGAVVGLHSVGMVNRPNLSLPLAMNAATGAIMAAETETVVTPPAKSVGEQIAEAIAAAVAPLTNQITELRTSLAAAQAAAATTATNAQDSAAFVFVESAINAGKITRDDASRAAWLRAFKADPATAQAQIAGLKPLAPAGSVTTTEVNAQTDKTLTTDELRMARALGQDPKTFVPRRLAGVK